MLYVEVLYTCFHQHSPVMGKLHIRSEQPSDTEAIRTVHLEAFETSAEADIVDQLRQTCSERISLVALLSDRIVGHILFTPALTQTVTHQIKGMGLAPLAVLPDVQGQGIGSALTEAGLEEVRAAGYPFVAVLGHPTYYPRFGFEPTTDYGLISEYEGVPNEAFMLLAFDPLALQQAVGEICYRPEFSQAM